MISLNFKQLPPFFPGAELPRYKISAQGGIQWTHRRPRGGREKCITILRKSALVVENKIMIQSFSFQSIELKIKMH